MTYLSSPYNHLNWEIRKHRFEDAHAAAFRMIRNGVHVFCPIAYGHQFANSFKDAESRWAYWKEFDLKMVAFCDKMIVLTLAGWDTSVGVSAEIAHATKLGKPIEFLAFSDVLERWPA